MGKIWFLLDLIGLKTPNNKPTHIWELHQNYGEVKLAKGEGKGCSQSTVCLPSSNGKISSVAQLYLMLCVVI